MRISVIIPTCNNERTITDCLESVLKQRPFEVIVVDKSIDNTPNIVKKYKKIRLLKQKKSGIADARNQGWKATKGDIIVFLDADCIPEKNWLKELLRPLKEKKGDVIQGVYGVKDGNLPARWTNYILQYKFSKLSRLDEHLRELTWLMTYSTAMKKIVLEKLGGFDTSFTECSGEDANLGHRLIKAGYKIILNHKSIVYHYHNLSAYTSLKKQFTHAKNRWLVAKKGKITDGNVSSTTYLEVILHGLFLLLLVFSITLNINFSWSAAFLFSSLFVDSRIGIWTFNQTKDPLDIFITFFYFLTVISWLLGAIYGLKNIYSVLK